MINIKFKRILIF